MNAERCRAAFEEYLKLANNDYDVALALLRRTHQFSEELIETAIIPREEENDNEEDAREED